MNLKVIEETSTGLNTRFVTYIRSKPDGKIENNIEVGGR